MQDRILPLDGVVNFRDFGGYDTPRGPLKRRVLWRSASFHAPSDADVAKLDALGLRFLVDLRRGMERVTEPNVWPGENCRRIQYDEDEVKGLAPHLEALLGGDLTADGIAAYMTETYRGFHADRRLVSLYRSWFAELAQGGAGVIHCAAGKDRTGLGCALTLFALGVREEDVFADYEFTNQAIDLEARLPRIRGSMERRVGKPLSTEVLIPMLGVNVDYLHAALDTIKATYGSVDAYLAQVLGVGAPERDALRAHLLA